MLTVYTAAMAWLALAVSLWSHDIVRIMTTPDFYEGARVVPWVAASHVFLGASLMVNSGLAVRNRMNQSGVVVTITAVLNLALNLWLVPRYGFMGAAWATFASYALQTALQTWVNIRVWRIPYEYGKLLALTVGWMAALGLARLSPDSSWPSLAWRAVLLVAFGGLALALVRARAPLRT
jgi:O-antigen/teichoic acid export membrane protein